MADDAGVSFGDSCSSQPSQADQHAGTLTQRLHRQCLQLHKLEGTTSSHTMQYPPSSSSNNAFATIPIHVLRRYIEYAKRYCHPQLTPPAAKVIQKLYLTMRAQSSLGASIPVTTRHLESLIRLSQARARVELREHVTG